MLATRQIFVRSSVQIGFGERSRMAGEFLAQGRNLFFRDRAAVVSPLLSLISENVGNLLVTQTFPGLHDGAAELLSLDRDRTLQALHHDHGGATGAAIRNFRTGQGWITLALRSESVCLVADLTIRGENFLTALRGREFLLLLLTATTRSARLFRCRNAARIQAIAAESTGIAPEICAAEEKRERVNSNQPQREGFQSYAWFLFLPLNCGVHFLHFFALSIIHALARSRCKI